jgi:hypothetical protein
MNWNHVTRSLTSDGNLSRLPADGQEDIKGCRHAGTSSEYWPRRFHCLGHPRKHLTGSNTSSPMT